MTSLREYLGGVTEYLDLVLDQAALGMRVVPGSHRYSVGANWKLMIENSMDGYHAPTVHATYFDFVKDSGGGQREDALLHRRRARPRPRSRRHRQPGTVGAADRLLGALLR